MIFSVSGDHTRTIRIATPSIGGLMKFAVKTVTCLGCKTPLRANNSKDKSLFRIQGYAIVVDTSNRRSDLQQLSTKNRGTISQASRNYVRIASAVFTTMDTMSTMSRIAASGRFDPALETHGN